MAAWRGVGVASVASFGGGEGVVTATAPGDRHSQLGRDHLPCLDVHKRPPALRVLPRGLSAQDDHLSIRQVHATGSTGSRGRRGRRLRLGVYHWRPAKFGEEGSGVPNLRRSRRCGHHSGADGESRPGGRPRWRRPHRCSAPAAT